MHSMIAFRQVCQSPLSFETRAHSAQRTHARELSLFLCVCYLSFQVNALASRFFFLLLAFSFQLTMIWNRTIAICLKHFTFPSLLHLWLPRIFDIIHSLNYLSDAFTLASTNSICIFASTVRHLLGLDSFKHSIEIRMPVDLVYLHWDEKRRN